MQRLLCLSNPILERKILLKLWRVNLKPGYYGVTANLLCILSVRLLVSFLFPPLREYLDSITTLTAVCCHRFPGCWIDVTDLHAPFVGILKQQKLPSNRSGTRVNPSSILCLHNRRWRSKKRILSNPFLTKATLTETWSCQVMPSILLRQRVWNASRVRSRLEHVFYVSLT